MKKRIMKHLSKLALYKKKIVGRNNTIINNSIHYKTNVKIKGSNNKVFIEEGAMLKNNKIIINGSNNKLIIEKGCKIKNSQFWFENDFGEIHLKRNTTTEEVAFSVVENNSSIIVGEDCMFSFGIEIRTSDSHSIVDLYTNKRINEAQDVIIKNHVWIGANATILKGSYIEDDSVIGIGSIVTGKVSRNTVVAGIPAREIKTNITWLRERV